MCNVRYASPAHRVQHGWVSDFVRGLRARGLEEDAVVVPIVALDVPAHFRREELEAAEVLPPAPRTVSYGAAAQVTPLLE